MEATHSGSEGQTTADLDDALRACGRGDLGVVARSKICGGVGETDQVEDVGSFAAELEHDTALELDVAEDAHVDILEPGAVQVVAAGASIRATRPGSSCHAGTIGNEGCLIEPFARDAVGGANSATVRIELGADASNEVGAVTT